MSEKIDINIADEAALTAITGIGPALAQRIVEYRETVHPYEEVIELAAVPGISEKMVRGFADKVTVDVTAVSAGPGEEEPTLLAAPDPLEMLEPPPQPEALLEAELPAAETAGAEDETAADVVEESPPEEESVADSSEAEDVIYIGAREDALAAAEAAEEEVAAAVPSPEAPVVEETRQAESVSRATEPEQPAAPPVPPSDWEARAQRRGCITTLLGATFGAILGAVLTLAILAAVNNGSINYAANNSAVRQQLDTEIISRTNELNTLSTRVSLVATQEAVTNEALQDDLAAANEAINEELANNEEIVSYLATRSGDFELRLREVAGAADTFVNFLDGMRLLLDDLDDSPATPARQTPTPTPVNGGGTPTPTPLSTGTAQPATTTTAQPTRTPQPTATQLSFPTSTPASQP